MEKRIFYVYGRVQGVGFRFFTCQQAKKLGLVGTVRNRQDGSVEVVAHGLSEPMSALRAWLSAGSPAAKVDRVIEYQDDRDQLFDRFQILY